jgi:hypothetical protein
MFIKHGQGLIIIVLQIFMQRAYGLSNKTDLPVIGILQSRTTCNRRPEGFQFPTKMNKQLDLGFLFSGISNELFCV